MASRKEAIKRGGLGARVSNDIRLVSVICSIWDSKLMYIDGVI